MVRILLIRLAIFVLPFVGWALWRAIGVRRGRPVRPTPWAWLIGGGALLVAFSLVVTVLVPAGPDTGVYVPGQVGPDGRVGPGHFVPRP